MVFIGVDLDQIDKMAPRRVKSAPGPIELNQHFGAKTDLLDLECTGLSSSSLAFKSVKLTLTPMVAPWKALIERLGSGYAAEPAFKP